MDNEIFSSPSKKREGVINLASPSKKKKTRAAARQPVPTLHRGIITTTPKKNGRAGLISPSKRSNTDLDRSARKRAIASNYAKLMDNDYSDDDEDLTLADKIIEASKKDGGKPILYESEGESETETIVKSEIDDIFRVETDDSQLGTKQKEFVPTPVPEESQFLLEKKFDDRALFLDGFEGFFEQHKTKIKTSGNAMSQLASLEYDEYLRNIKLVDIIQSKGKENLLGLHRNMFKQWYYELMQGFNLCFYGIGSKRDMCLEFTQNFLLPRLDHTECCVINGYNPDVSLKEILSVIVPVLLPDYKSHKLSRVPMEVVNYLLKILPTSNRPFLDLESSPQLILLINNIDGKALRDERFQTILSSLSQINSIWIIATIDNINSPLMWDSSKLSKFRFVWHDLTTFKNYNVENSFKDILSLGRSSKFQGSKGAKYVLSSLTSNAKSLYRILVSHQLEIMEDDPELIKKPELKGSLIGSLKYGLEFKNLYQLCLAEFVTSNEVSFRTMLHEFIEHKMCNLVKDSGGTEMVWIPFKIDELQKLLEEELLD